MKPFRVDFLWVRWYGVDTKHKSGFKAKRPHWVGFVDSSSPKAFGFLDPNDVIRAVHLLSVYKLGRTPDFLPPSIARRPSEHDEIMKGILWICKCYQGHKSKPLTLSLQVCGP